MESKQTLVSYTVTGKTFMLQKSAAYLRKSPNQVQTTALHSRSWLTTDFSHPSPTMKSQYYTVKIDTTKLPASYVLVLYVTTLHRNDSHKNQQKVKVASMTCIK